VRLTVAHGHYDADELRPGQRRIRYPSIADRLLKSALRALSVFVHRLLLWTADSPLRSVSALAYRGIARAWAMYLARGLPGATAYVRGSLAGDEFVPGLSDVDVAIVLPGGAAGDSRATDRAIARWERLHRASPVVDLLLDYPLVIAEDELRKIAGRTAITYGLGSGAAGGAIYHGVRVSPDRIRLLERPGLWADTASWRRLSGHDRRPAPPEPDPQLRRIAAWLELSAWWQWVFPVCAGARGPRTASLCVKLIAEPARIWLWLAAGERVERRVDVLTRARELLPQEGEAFERALELQRELPRAPEPPLTALLPALVRLSSRIAELIAAELVGAGSTPVRLAGGDGELILAHGRWRPVATLAGGERPQPLPLCDWRALVRAGLPDPSFSLVAGELSDPVVLGAACASQPAGPHPALRGGDLIVFPGARTRSQLRAIKAPFSDPVTFALAGGGDVALFPNTAGFSAQDAAARALAEHRAWLTNAPARTDDPDAAGGELAMLLSAARAALFAQTLADGAAVLAVTIVEAAARLAAFTGADAIVAEALGQYREFAVYRTPPAAPVIDALRTLVEALPPYADPPADAGRTDQIRSAMSWPLAR
jgi:hypothetical protein